MKNAILFLFLLLTFTWVSAQVKVDTLTQNQLPANLKFKGNFICCLKWTDALGTNYLITSESKITRSKKAKEAIKTSNIERIENNKGKIDTIYDKCVTDLKTKDIWAINYIINHDTTKVLWEMHDYFENCYGGLRLEFQQLPVVTNLNNNDTCQTWIIYKLNCSSDVRPSDMKLIMHIGPKKYAIRGKSQIVLSGKKDCPGTKELDYDFNQLPASIIDFANKLWTRYQYDMY